MIFREKATTRIDDFGADGYMLLPALLKVLENAADHHSAAVADESVEDSMHGVAWILAEWRVELIKPPTFNDEIRVETWISDGAAAAYSNREFLVLDKDGTALVKASAKLTLFDLCENRIIRTDRSVLEKYLPEGKTVFSEKPRRLVPAKSFYGETTFSLRRSDIDYNGHVHNTNYLCFAQEVLSESAAQSTAIASFRISYKRPLRFGDCVVIKSAEEDGVVNICIFGNEELCAVVEIVQKSI